MKNIFLYTTILAALVFTSACNENEDLVTADAQQGGLVSASSTSNSYVVGNPGPYVMEFFAYQGQGIIIESLDLYKSFAGNDIYKDSKGKDSLVAYSSNEILDQTVTVSDANPHFFTVSYNYDDLIKGLSAKGNPLPSQDVNLNIGDQFLFRAVAHLNDGRTVEQSYTISFTVSTRYAGDYATIEAEYYRIGVLTYTTSDWPAVTTIQSVDASTYKVLEYFGAFDGNEWYFQINNGKISYPDKTPDGAAQTGNGQPFITCESNPADMTNVPCTNSNYVVNDDVKGEDKLYMTFGYYTSGSGSREFYQVLQKIVN